MLNRGLVSELVIVTIGVVTFRRSLLYMLRASFLLMVSMMVKVFSSLEEDMLARIWSWKVSISALAILEEILCAVLSFLSPAFLAALA